MRWLALAYLFALPFTFHADRINAPWLPFWRRYLPSLGVAMEATIALAGRSVPGALVFSVIALQWWNIWTGLRNMRGNKRGKPAPSLGATLTAVQVATFQREAHDAR